MTTVLETEFVLQLVALLIGGGAVSGTTAWVHKRQGPSSDSMGGVEEAISNLKATVERMEGSISTRLDRIDRELKDATKDRNDLRIEVEILKREQDRALEINHRRDP